RLADKTPLLQWVRAGRERRILGGEAAREAAQHAFAKAPTILSDILTDEQIPPRHRIEAARELRQAAGTGPETASEAREKFIIHIDFGGDEKLVREFDVPKRPLRSDDGEPPSDNGELP